MLLPLLQICRLFYLAFLRNILFYFLGLHCNSIFFLSFQVGLIIATFLLPHVTTFEDHSNHHQSNGSSCDYGGYVDELSVACFIHGGLWFILFGFDRYLRYQHYRHRMCGYLEFYRRTRHLRKIPFLANSGGIKNNEVNIHVKAFFFDILYYKTFSSYMC